MRALAGLLWVVAAAPLGAQLLGSGDGVGPAGPVELEAARAAVAAPTDPLDHVVNLGLDGRLRAVGPHGTGPDHLASRLYHLLRERQVAGLLRGVLVHAHGGLVSEAWALDRVRIYRELLAGTGIFPIILVWNTDAETIASQLPGGADTDPDALRVPVVLDLLGAAARGLVGLGGEDEAALQRAQGRGYSPPVSRDRAIERVARRREHGAAWARLKANALGASRDGGGAHMLAQLLADLGRAPGGLPLHLVGHSAGSLLLGGLVDSLRGLGQPVASVQLRAPAATVAFHRETYASARAAGMVGRMAVYALTPEAELADDVHGQYGKSMLHLVKNAFEDSAPLLGLADDVAAAAREGSLGPGPAPDLVLCPNDRPEGDWRACRARTHDAIGIKDPVVLAASLAYLRLPPAPIP